MVKKTLIVDKDFADANKLKNYISLFPSIGHQPPWSLKFNEHTQQHHSIVDAKEKLAYLFAKEIYVPALGYKQEACERIFLSHGTLLVYVIADRLLRLNKVLSQYDISDINLPSVDFKFNRNVHFAHLYYRVVEEDPIYNQWLIQEMLPEAEQIEFSLVEQEEFLNSSYSNQERKTFIEKVFHVLISGRFFNKMKFYLINLYPQIIFFISRKKLNIPIDSGDINFKEMQRKLHKFFWPRGNLSPLKSNSLKTESKESNNISRDDFYQLKDKVSDIFKELIINSDHEIFLPDSSFEKLIYILINQIPTDAIETVEIQCKKYLKEIEKYKGSCLLVGGTGSSLETSFRVFAAKQLSIPVLAMQHSGWGGYLANGALVTETLIDGSDYYITFGWDNQTQGESTWKKSAIILPNPFLSELEKKFNKNRFQETDNRRFLFSLGFIYRFPALYNSFLRLDIINDYLSIIEKSFEVLTNEGYIVCVSFYNSQVEQIFTEKKEAWKKKYGNGIEFLSDHDIKLRTYMQEDFFDEMYDAVIWDLPAGGFGESLAMGKKTFSLFNHNIIKATDEAKEMIEDLTSVGIFFSNPNDLVQSLNQMNLVSNWYQEEKRLKALKKFQKKYFLTHEQWDEKWDHFLKNSYDLNKS